MTGDEGPSSPVLRRAARGRGPLLLALGFGVLAAAPLLAHSGFLSTRGGGDSPFLLLRLHQLLAALSAGEFPARWMPDAAYGYGYPFFSYYASAPYYLAALLRAYGFSYVAALKLTQLGALLAAAAATYAWARALPLGRSPAEPGLSRPQAVLAAAAYTFAPFHLVNLYVRGDSLSELWAMGLYPLCLWLAQRCLERPSLGRSLALAGSVGLLAFTHNISALNFMPFLALYLVLAGRPRERSPQPAAPGPRLASARPVAIAFGALVWGLALAAFFWLPALRETGAVQIGDVTQGYFSYQNHFRGRDLVQPSLFFNPETTAGNPTPFSMGLAQALAAAAGLGAWLGRRLRARRWTRVDTFCLAGLALSTWMITPASAWAWEHLPLVRYTQFPWRFLSIQALFTALLTAQLLPGARPAWPSRPAQWALAVGVGLALALFGLGRLRPDFIPVPDSAVTPPRLQLLEYFTANIGSTIGYEYLPRDAQPRPYVSDRVLGRAPRLKVLAGTATGALEWKRGSRERWAVTVTGGPATVAVPTYYWPGWSAVVDGQPTPVRAAEGLGWMALDLEPGAHTVGLWLARTPLRAAAETLSLAALWLGVAPWLYQWAVTRGRTRTPAAARPWAAALIGLAALAAGALVLRLWPQPASDAPLSMDFAQLTYPHAAAVRFAGGATLRRVEYSAERPARGSTLVITSTWQGVEPVTVTLSLEPGSNLLSPMPVAVSAAAQALPGAGEQRLTHTLPVPADIPPGLYFVTVRVTGEAGEQAALTSAGRERGLVHLRPVLIDDEPGIAPAGQPLARFGPSIELLAASTAAAPGTLEVRPQWRANAEVPASYAVALRLRDAAGTEWTGWDAQLAYGYYPAPVWRPGEVVPDLYRLPLPPGAPPGDYTLSIDVYYPPTLASLGVATVRTPVTATTPLGERQPQHALIPALALGRVELPARLTQGESPEVRAEWLVLAAPGQDYRAEWTLTPLAAGAPLTQTLELAPGSPSSTWPADTFILGRTRLATPPDLAPGSYAVALRLVDAAGQPAGPEVALGQVEVAGQARSFSLPAYATEVGATFGPALKLWGYTAAQDAASLRLTLVWSALEAPGADYKFFVHLFNPADEFVAAQVDAMPHANTYPTALWAAGEVVTDSITLPLAGLAPGRYRVAVGWYDPTAPGLPRLPARDAQGQPLPADRAVLPLEVAVP